MEIARLVWALAIGLGAAGCTQADRPAAPRQKPSVYWIGYLSELNGQATGESGIKLEILGYDPDDVGYNLSTGCVAGGRIERDGTAYPAEVLRPCVLNDIGRLGAINRIAPSALTGEPMQRVTLTWTRDAAVLKSSEGEARFVAIH